MIKKFSVFCILLFAFSIMFRGFTAQQTGSETGSGSKVEPPVAFKKWRIGRSPETTSSKTFITSTQELCRFSASVGYGEITNKANTSPIDPTSVGWSVTKGSNEIALKEGSVQHNWSGPNPARLDSTTRFNVVGVVTVEKVVGTRVVQTSKGPKIVPDYKKGWTACTTDANRANRVPVHRDGAKMKFKLNFSAQTEAGQPVSAVLALEADKTDQLRQEYVDYDKPIPSYDDFEDEDTYDFGHYTNMLNESLGDNFQNWIDSMNKQRQDINTENAKKGNNAEILPDLTKADFTLNSGFRQPHHNFDHAGSISLLSSHMYGYALDVNGRDIDGKSGADQSKMVQAAKNATPPARFSQKYPNKTHVHADWAPRDWKARAEDENQNSAGDPPNDFSLPPAGTDTVACQKQTENSCSVQVSSSREHYVTCPSSSCATSYWTCDSDDYDEHRLRTCNWEKMLGGRVCNGTFRLCEYPIVRIPGMNLHTQGPRCPTDPNELRVCEERNTQTTPPPPDTVTYACGVHDVGSDPVSSHALQASCSVTDSHGQQCTVTGFYKCQSHTHQYPALISGVCGHTYTSAQSNSHRSVTCPTDSNGNACTSGSYYVCQSHTHQYPAPAITCNGCSTTVNYKWVHWRRCSLCNKAYYTCKLVGLRWHTQQKTCKRTKNGVPCGQSFYSCSNPNTCFYGWTHSGSAHHVN